MRREAADLARAIAESEASYRDEETKGCFSSLLELMECLKSAPVPNEWIVIHRPNCALFLNIVDESMPMLRSSVTVFSDLSISVCFHGTKLSRIGDYVVPGSIGNVNVLSAILSRLQSILDEKCSSEGLCDVVVSLLEQLERDAIDSKKRISRFLREQVALLGKQRLQYSSESMVVACILHTISPHAYKFLRGSGFFAMPHPSTCRNVCSSFQLSPDTESDSENFLRYIKHRFKQLQPHESSVVLMLDEIHIQPFFDFKGGKISGAAANSEEAATSAHVFMVQSMPSSFREVVHILPARTMNSHSLHAVLKNVIIGLEEIGFKVLAVVSDNNAINRKALSMFSDPPKLSIVYPNPKDATRPMFYVVDSVHLLKCIRNNWINQKNLGTNLYFPMFDLSNNSVHPDCIQWASFKDLRELHKLEASQLLKYSYRLSSKALNPSNFERQNVKLVLQIFNAFVAEALDHHCNFHALWHAKETANFIRIVLRWWKIVNVKTPHKGHHHRDVYEEPVSCLNGDPKLEFLDAFVTWLDVWESYKHDNGILTRETQSALRHSAYAILEFTKYCLVELRYKYVLLGKLQTDGLENRFGQYRQMAGGHYHISIRQLYESEGRIRLQNTLPIMSSDDFIDEAPPSATATNQQDFRVTVKPEDLDSLSTRVAVFAYVGGFCTNSVVKTLKCNYCQENLVADSCDAECDGDANSLIASLNRGGLKFPNACVVTVVMHTEVVVAKLLQNEKNAACFLQTRNHRGIVQQLVKESLPAFEELLTCANGHEPDLVINMLIKCATNVLLNNYCKERNDAAAVAKADAKAVAKARKLKTVAPK